MELEKKKKKKSKNRDEEKLARIFKQDHNGKRRQETSNSYDISMNI